MKRLLFPILLALIAFAVSGCSKGNPYSPDATPDTGVEGELLRLTDVYASRLAIAVRGEIATSYSKAQLATHQDAAGWYEGGVAYYHRDAVAKYVDLVDGTCPSAPQCELASGVAAHEVCHAFQEANGRMTAHDQWHWCCMKNLGVRPTYQSPTLINGQWPTCEGIGTR